MTNKAIISAGSSISLTIKDFKNDALLLEVSKDRFILRSFADAKRIYAIDQITTGLNLFACEEGWYPGTLACEPCLEPCKTCEAPGDICTSCYDLPDVNDKQLYEKKCFDVISCPDN